MGIEINDDTDYHATEDDFTAIAAATEQIASSAINAQAIFQANARRAADELVNLALSANNETVRFNAAKYVVERVLGRVPDKAIDPKDSAAPWANVYEAIVVSEPSAAQRALGASHTVSQAAPQGQARNSAQ